MQANYAKVVRVVDPLSVLLVPHNETSVGCGPGAAGRLEILSFAFDSLGSRGQVNSQEPILRPVPLPPSHVATVTESSVGIVQITPTLALTASVSLKQNQVPDAGIPDTAANQNIPDLPVCRCNTREIAKNSAPAMVAGYGG